MTNKNIFQTKKAATLGSWVETMLFLVLFIGVFAIIGVGMNNDYGQNNDVTFGIVGNDTLNDLKDLQTKLAPDVNEGQMSQTSLGLFIITTVPKILSTIWNIIWNFLTGEWISKAVGLLGLGESAGLLILILRILYFSSIIFIILRIATRVNP